MGTAMLGGDHLDYLSLLRNAVLCAVELHPKHRRDREVVRKRRIFGVEGVHELSICSIIWSRVNEGEKATAKSVRMQATKAKASE